MVQLATNNAYALIPDAVSSLDTTFTIEAGRGALFPILGTGDYFYATLIDVLGNNEIVKVTARTADIFTVERGAQGTIPIPFPANSRIELRVTAANIITSSGGTTNAADIIYTSFDVTDWNGDVDPGQVDDALDQLADRLVTVETAVAGISNNEAIIIACSDETTALTAGIAKTTFRMPYAFVLTGVRASLTTPQTSGSIFTVDINYDGGTVLSTKLTIDNTEKTSTTAATPAVILTPALFDDGEITVDIDQIGDGTAKGLKVYLIGHQ